MLPPPFWFRLALPCRRLDAIPLTKAGGRFLDLPESCRLPETVRLSGREPWAEVRASWNPDGLGISARLSGKSGPVVRDRALPDASEGLVVWLDTRDTRDIHRASRFCHRYDTTLVPEGKTKLAVEVARRPINRALADPPKGLADPSARAEMLPDGWLLELFLPAAALHGYDVETNRRLGFSYRVTDPRRGDQFLGVGRDFPVAEDPSLWATLELIDEPA